MKVDSNRGRGNFRGNAKRGFRGAPGIRGARGNSTPTTREGDWKCADSACSSVNFAFRKECHRCKVPKEGNGDWQCSDTSCGNINVSSRKECQRCKVPNKAGNDDKKLKSNFGGGDQGRVNRSLGGVYVDSEEAGSIPRMDGKIIVEPIEEGLQLFVTFNKVPSLEYMEANFEGFHSSSTVKKNSKVTSQILLFKSIESLESAKTKLEDDEHVESVDSVGMKSSKNQQESNEECRQIFLKFPEPTDEDKVKELDSNIESVFILKDKRSCIVTFLPFDTHESASSAIASLKLHMRKINKTIGETCCKPCFRMRYFLTSLYEKTPNRKVILRDVPKAAKLEDFAKLFPDAVSFTLYDNTFPASEYCHALVRCADEKKAVKILEMRNLKILGKKVYASFGFHSMMKNKPLLGVDIKSEDEKKALNITSEPPKKKSKLESEPISIEERDQSAEESIQDVDNEGESSSEEKQEEDDEEGSLEEEESEEDA